MKKLFTLLKAHKGLYLSSNAYFGVGLNDCVSNAKKVAKKFIEEAL
jgi:protoporphyrinogen oxidase